jgi:hypothetical protein
MKPVKLEAERYHLTDARVFTLSIAADAFNSAWLKLSPLERGMIESSSGSISDSLLALEQIVRKIEQLEENDD